MKTKTMEDTRRFAEKVAEHQGWQLNPDLEFREMILEGLTANHNRYAFYQCPCRDSWADAAKDADIKCPCEYSRPDIAEFGRCFCNLFMAREASGEALETVPIPERRPADRYP